MKVLSLDLVAQYASIRSEVEVAIERVCAGQRFILGPEVEALEAEIARYCGVNHAVGLSSGSDALLAALTAVGVKPGDEVVTSAYSFISTASVVGRLGAKPVFVDIDSESLTIDVDAAVESLSSRTRAIVPVHLFGRCVELDRLLEVAASRGIAVVEDAAQAIGATDSGGRVAGSLGEIGCLSFYPSKNLGGFGDGGMVILDDVGTAQRLRAFRNHGDVGGSTYATVGGNFRLDALQAAVLRVKLRYLPKWTEARRARADRYRRLIDEAGLEEIVRAPAVAPGHVYNQFVVRVPERDRLRGFLNEKGVETAVYYSTPLHLQPCFRSLGYERGSLPQAEAAAAESLALPIHPELAPEKQAYVVERIQEFYAR